MPARLDRVRIVCPRGIFAIPRRSRDALLDQIQHLDSAKGIRTAFVTVGAARHVTLDGDDVAVLSRVIEGWARKAGAQRLPPGLWDLRNELHDEVDS